VSALTPGNFQLFADGPNRPLFDFAMVRDAGDLAQGRVEPNAMGAALTALRKSEADKGKERV